MSVAARKLASPRSLKEAVGRFKLKHVADYREVRKLYQELLPLWVPGRLIFREPVRLPGTVLAGQHAVFIDMDVQIEGFSFFYKTIIPIVRVAGIDVTGLIKDSWAHADSGFYGLVLSVAVALEPAVSEQLLSGDYRTAGIGPRTVNEFLEVLAMAELAKPASIGGPPRRVYYVSGTKIPDHPVFAAKLRHGLYEQYELLDRKGRRVAVPAPMLNRLVEPSKRGLLNQRIVEAVSRLGPVYERRVSKAVVGVLSFCR